MSDSCDPMDCSLPGSPVHGILQVRKRVGCHFLLQRIFPTQESNLSLLHCRQILYQLSYEGSPCNLEILSIRKDSSRRTLQPHWRSPYQVLLANLCPVRLQEIDS